MLFVEIHKWYGVFLYKCTNITKSRNFFKKVVTNTRQTTLTKQMLLLGAKNWRCIRYMSILTKGLQTSITDTSSYLYYRTPHYQSPETIARQHYTDTWVEQIQSYPIDGVDVKSLA